MSEKRLGIYLGMVQSIYRNGGVAVAHKLLLEDPGACNPPKEISRVIFYNNCKCQFRAGIWEPKWYLTNEVPSAEEGSTLTLDIYKETGGAHFAKRWGYTHNFAKVINQMAKNPIYRLRVKYPEGLINYWSGRLLTDLRKRIRPQLDDFPNMTLPYMVLQVHYFGEEGWCSLPEDELNRLLAR